MLTPPTSHAAVLRLQLKREVAKLKQQLNHGNAGDHDVRAGFLPLFSPRSVHTPHRFVMVVFVQNLRERWRTADADVKRLNTVNKQLRRVLDTRTDEKIELQAKFDQLRALYVPACLPMPCMCAHSAAAVHAGSSKKPGVRLPFRSPCHATWLASWPSG